MLAHEQAHLERGDILTTTIGVMWLCALWFNPLMYWAIARLRFDQELACDAMVLARSQAGPRHYAHTLLKAQLAADSPWRIPLSCHWLSTHPLKERIAMLKRPSPGSTRRLLGIVLTCASIVAGSSLVWATQSEPAHIAGMQKDDLQFDFSADHISKLTNGDVTLTGNVSFRPLRESTSNLIFAAARVIEMDDHSVLLEGAVRLSLGRYMLTTDRAILGNDGLVTMDSALLSPTSETD